MAAAMCEVGFEVFDHAAALSPSNPSSALVHQSALKSAAKHVDQTGIPLNGKWLRSTLWDIFFRLLHRQYTSSRSIKRAR